MKFTASFLALCGATAVTARPGSCKKHHDPLTLQHFGNFTLISLQDAKAGIVKSHNGTTHKIPGYPAHGYSTAPYSMSQTSSSAASSSTQAGYAVLPPSASTGYAVLPSSASTGYAVLPVLTGSASIAVPTSVAYGHGAAPSSSSSSSYGHPASSSAASVSESASASAPILVAPSVSTSSASSTFATVTSASASQTQSISTSSSSTSSAPAASSSVPATCATRTEWRSYSSNDRHAFAAGIKCLMNKAPSGDFPQAKNRYEDLVRVHQMMTSTIHGNNLFLLWHRYYVWTLEEIMKEECGYSGTFPWWDETLDAGNFAGSSIFTSEFFGSLPGPTGGSGTCITDGYFANTVAHIGPGTGFTDHCLSRAVDESLTASCNKDFVVTCNARTTYPDMENCAELGPHGYGHNGIGSVMADVSASPSDPAFFLHHLFIDRNYWLWQNTADVTARKSAITGCIDSASPCTALTLDTVITVQGLRPDVTVRDVIDTEKGALCYSYSY